MRSAHRLQLQMHVAGFRRNLRTCYPKTEDQGLLYRVCSLDPFCQSAMLDQLQDYTHLVVVVALKDL